MYSSTERKLVIYTSLFIAVLFNIYKLMALREGALISQYWHFNGFELLFETFLNFSFCLAVAYINLYFILKKQNAAAKIPLIILINLILLFASDALGIGVQRRIFLNPTPIQIFRLGYTVRLLASLVLMAILVQVLLLLRKQKEKENENTELRAAYLNAQLELLKEELNPHFFFNALSSLSAIVREDPQQAQQYISHLSKIFRYTLNRVDKNLVSLKDELAIFNSYAALQKMRLENSLAITLDITSLDVSRKLPYMSLQPLLENAVKHNSASLSSPLHISVSVIHDCIVVKNNLQENLFKDESTGIGLANLNERFKILLHKEIDIQKTQTEFIVKLPLLKA